MAKMVRLDGLRATQLVGCITVDPTSEWSTHLSLLLVLLLPGLRVWYGCRIYVIDFVCNVMYGLPGQAVCGCRGYTATRLCG